MNQQKDSDDEGEIVWAKGDICLSPYSGDGKLYRAVIRKVQRDTDTGDVRAVVAFDGYEDEEESVPVQKLKPRKRNIPVKSGQQSCSNGLPTDTCSNSGFFKPLFGTEDGDRLAEKYGCLDNDGNDDSYTARVDKLSSPIFVDKSNGCSSQLSSSSKPSSKSSQNTRSRKSVVAVGGEALVSPKRQNRKDSCNSDVPSPMTSTSCHDPKPPYNAAVRDEDRHQGHHDGFTENDTEKPQFSFAPVSTKVPFQLSGSGETPVVQVPATINQYLRDYQREGIKFLYGHYTHNRGALLGDDMGLGKTVQVIGFLAALLGKQGSSIDMMRQKPSFIRKLSDSSPLKDDIDTRPFLIIGPGCVLYNWLDELETWGYFSVRKYHGTEKLSCLADLKKGKVEVVVTTFETYRDNQESLNAVDWNAVIVDEVHRIKGLKAQTTQALRGVTTSCRFGLTGTALQNNLLELWSIADWAQPGCLGLLSDFESEYVQPIERGQKHDASKRELALARKKKDKFANIRKSLMLRRMKNIIADQLPKKDDNVVFCRLSQLQTSIYQTILEHRDMQLVLHMDDPCDCGSGVRQSRCCYMKTSTGGSVCAMMFTFMHLLLKVANHVALLIPNARTSDKQVQASHSICRDVLQQHPNFINQTREAAFRTLSNPKFCGKMKILQGLLRVFSRDHSKVLVFSYSTQALDILEQYIMSTGYEYRRIDGSVSSKKRMDIVRDFNKDLNIFICLISTKAGGLGLNLTGANRVVIFDPNWNPTYDLQAQDRAYRIGQRRNVQVYRLVSAGTIEENMYLRQIYKQQLLNVAVEDENARRYFYAVQGDKTQKGELFGVKNMFRLRTGSSCLTMDILKRNEKVETGLMGYQITEYIPPVMKQEEPDTDDSEVDANVSVGSTTSEESGDAFTDFFSSQSETEDEGEESSKGFNITDGCDIDSMDIEYEENCKIDSTKSEELSKHSNVQTSLLNPGTSSAACGKKQRNKTIKASYNKTPSLKSNLMSGATPSNKKKQCLQFVEPVSETESKLNKEPVRKRESRQGKSLSKKHSPIDSSDESDIIQSDDGDDDVPRLDQTLAGSFSDVGAVFDQCGVLHIHENVKIVGGSRAEDHMTRCAITDVFELHQNSQELAVHCDPLSESSEDEEEEELVPVNGRRIQGSGEDHNAVRSTVIGQSKVLIGQTPKGIRKRQYEQMTEHHSAETLIDFAEMVLRATVEERVKLLNGYYGDQDPDLANVLVIKKNSNTPKNGKEKSEMNSSGIMRSTQSTGKGKKHTASKLRVKGRKGQGRGLIFDEITDSESLGDKAKARINKDVFSDCGESSMEIGTKATPAKKRQPYCKTRTRTLQNKKNSAKIQHTFVSPSYIYTDLTLDEDDPQQHEESMEAEPGHNEDPDELLSQLGKTTVAQKCYDTVDGSYNHNVESHFKLKATNVFDNSESLLDDIFSEQKPGITKRKPPPSKRKNNDKKAAESKAGRDAYENSSVLFTESSMEGSEDMGILTTSTLKDDNYDCFNDPSKWKKRKRKSPEQISAVDKLISDSDSEYNKLFATGKMKKKSQKSEEEEKAEIPSDKKREKKPSYMTPSLFDTF